MELALLSSDIFPVFLLAGQTAIEVMVLDFRLTNR